MAERILVAGIVLAVCLHSACSTHETDPNKVRQQAANATAELKSDVKAAAQGIREGWERDKVLDLNSAPETKLVTLPGISAGAAEDIVRNRPYHSTDELVKKGILSEADYRKIVSHVTVK